MNLKCLQDRNCKRLMSYIIDRIIFARSATIIENSANGLNLDVEIPEGIFDISTILSFAYGNSAIKHNETKITFNKEPGVVAFRCLKVKLEGKIIPYYLYYYSIQGKMEEQEQKEEMEVVEDFAPISYGGGCIGFEDRIKYNIML